MERQEAWVPNSGIEKASISIAGITVSTIDPASLDFGTGSNLPIGGSVLVFDQSELSMGNYGVSGSLTSSFDFFSIGLWLVGLIVVCIGLFSLSLEKRIGSIDSKELAHQMSTLSLVTATRNVSKNWGVKKEATWFVAMGLSSMALGLLSWLI